MRAIRCQLKALYVYTIRESRLDLYLLILIHETAKRTNAGKTRTRFEFNEHFIEGIETIKLFENII